MLNTRNPIYLYRITDYRNFEDIIKNGICCSNSDKMNENYVNIGHKNLIDKRGNKPVPVAPFGVLNDYVPFYYAPRSPMLYSIHTGYVENYKGTQEDIIYIVCEFSKIKKAKLSYVITDGHAFESISRYYNEEKDFIKIDWKIMGEAYWNNTDDDPDRKRRRMAEFLVYKFVPAGCISAIVVCNSGMKNMIDSILNKHNIALDVIVKRNWYY